jgi:GNAT superfamily N-acetyltransferase
MSMNSMQFLNPTKFQLESIIKWLKKEHLEELDGESGFYCNRDIIRESFRETEIKCLVQGRITIGFSTFRLRQTYSAIDIFEIRPGFRNKGLGRFLATNMINMLFTAGVPYITLKCVPRESEPFWKGLGFVDYQEKYSTSWSGPMLIMRPEHNNSFKPTPFHDAS